MLSGLGAIEPNPEFEVDKISEYKDVANWCHNVHYLLPQGRTVWWNPVQKADDEFEEEEYDEEDEKEQPNAQEPEDGPPLLTSAAEDASELWHYYYYMRSLVCIEHHASPGVFILHMH